jgi:hypothetical protein
VSTITWNWLFFKSAKITVRGFAKTGGIALAQNSELSILFRITLLKTAPTRVLGKKRTQPLLNDANK